MTKEPSDLANGGAPCNERCNERAENVVLDLCPLDGASEGYHDGNAKMATARLVLTRVGIALVVATSHSAAYCVDSASVEIGTGNRTKVIDVGIQWRWASQWWRSNRTHLGGYWDLGIAQWQGDRFQGVPDRHQNITSIGITPVFRFQSDSLKGFYVEAAIGAHLLSDLYDNNDRRLSTRFQFGDHVGAGYVSSNNLDMGIRLQHFSNGGIKEPNNGVNFALVRLTYRF